MDEDDESELELDELLLDEDGARLLELDELLLDDDIEEWLLELDEELELVDMQTSLLRNCGILSE